MDRTPSVPFGLLAVVLGVVGQFRSFATVIVPGTTMSGLGALFAVVSVVSFLLSPVGVFLVGYWAGGRVDVPTAWLPLAANAAVACLVGYLVGGLAVLALASASFAHAAPMVAVSLAYSALTAAVAFAVTGTAGASVRHFREVTG